MPRTTTLRVWVVQYDDGGIPSIVGAGWHRDTNEVPVQDAARKSFTLTMLDGEMPEGAVGFWIEVEVPVVEVPDVVRLEGKVTA